MRNLLIVVVLAILSSSIFAEPQIVNENSITIEWDAVTTLLDGSPLPTGETISYRVFMASDTTMPDTLVGETMDTFIVINFPTEGKYNIGVVAVRATGGIEIESTWAIMEVEYKQLPAEPTSLRIR